MFFLRHPQPVIDGRALVVQIVQQKATQAVSPTVLIVDKPAAPRPPAALVPKEE